MKGISMKLLKNKYIMTLLLIFSGALTALPIVFPSIGFLQWVSVIPAALVLIVSADDESVKLRRMYWRGILYFWSFYAVALHWFFNMYPLDFVGLSNAASIAVILVACFGLSLLQASFSAFAFLFFAKINRTQMVKSFGFAKPFIAAATFVIAEWFQNVGWWGVPWGRMPIGQINSLLFVRSSALFGSYFVTFALISVNFCLAYFILSKCKQRYFVAAALSAFALNLAFGLLVTAFYKSSNATIKVGVAQGNIASSDKWSADTLETTKDIYRELTVKAAEDGSDVVIWPETALPYTIMESVNLSAYVKDLAKECNVTIIVSAFTEDEESGLLANSMIEVKPDGSFGEDYYSKRRLVPFGEFVPMRSFVSFVFPPLANVGMLEEDLVAGEESVVIKSNVGYIGCGVCFDSIYENIHLESVNNGAQFIAISTNDSWFGDSAALYMHAAQSKLRAIETGRYIARSANTGISFFVDPMGEVVGELDILKSGYLVEDVELRTDKTLYSVIGNSFVYLCAGFAISLLVLDFMARPEKKKNK